MKSETANKTYGGFLELETNFINNEYHLNALKLSHGRACLAFILDHEKPNLIHVPFYTCGAVLEPIVERNIEIAFYNIDYNFDPVTIPESLPQNELLIYINYFGLKTNTTQKIANKLGAKLIADNCMSFFNKQFEDTYTYNSCRKFFGVPDGSYLYTPKPVFSKLKNYQDYSCDHLISRLGNQMDVCYEQFLENERTFNCNIFGMSTFTRRVMKSINYETVSRRRINNYNCLHQTLQHQNRLILPLEPGAVPHYYPLLLEAAPDRKTIATDNLFIPTLWPDILEREAENATIEIDLVKNLLPLPIDQRYNYSDMESMLEILKKYLPFS